jgi:hypothetical protein
MLCCGFLIPQQRLDVSTDGFVGYGDMNILSEKDVGDLAKAFADRTVANGRIAFGSRQQNLLKSTIHWVQDFRRIRRTPALDDVTDINDFKMKIQTARERSRVRRRNQAASAKLPILENAREAKAG